MERVKTLHSRSLVGHEPTSEGFGVGGLKRYQGPWVSCSDYTAIIPHK